MDAQRIGVMFLYLVISVDLMIVLGLFVYAISSRRKREHGRRHLRRKNDESRTASYRRIGAAGVSAPITEAPATGGHPCISDREWAHQTL